MGEKNLKKIETNQPLIAMEYDEINAIPDDMLFEPNTGFDAHQFWANHDHCIIFLAHHLGEIKSWDFHFYRRTKMKVLYGELRKKYDLSGWKKWISIGE